jgi:hypothetical protein
VAKKYHSFAEFWPFYLAQHSQKSTRILHLVGLMSLLPILFLGVFLNIYYLFLLPVCGYGFAWFAHRWIEHNRPATFSYPLWSFMADFKMCYMMVLGKLDDDVN